MSGLTTAVKLHISNATSFKKTTTHPNMETQATGKGFAELYCYLMSAFPYGKGRPATAQPPDPVTAKVSNGAPTGSAAHGLRGKVMTKL